MDIEKRKKKRFKYVKVKLSSKTPRLHTNHSFNLEVNICHVSQIPHDLYNAMQVQSQLCNGC